MPRNKKIQVSAISEKSVLVTVYVVVPRKRRFRTNKGKNNHHQRYVFAHEKPRPKGGYNRRTKLLEYSRQLRESARSPKIPVLQLQAKPADSLQQSKSQIVPIQKKLRSTKVPTCFGVLAIPGFSRSKRDGKKISRIGQSTKAKMMSIVKNLRVQRTGGFFSRMFGSLGRKR